VHTFANFDDADDHKILSVRQAFRDSVNLVFIRLMRDIVYHYLYRPGALALQLEASDSAQRQAYLERFADREGRTFLRRFYAKYRNKAPEEVLAVLTRSVYAHPARLATVYRSVYPEHDLAAFTDYLRAHLEARDLVDVDIPRLYDAYAPERFDLHDRGYIARLHPLELWLVAYLTHHPYASLQQVMGASSDERQRVYRWLFKTGRKYAQDKRIQALFEIEAFAEIQHAWQRLGYPFETLTPSYASAIGASGDRPAALAELIGVLLNDGVQAPRLRFDSYHFAAGTPYETLMTRPPAGSARLLAPEVAAAARSALIEVVEAGTARRLKGVYLRPDQSPLRVGGKTGTGDHRRVSYGAHGHLIGTQVVSRAATFVFFLGEQFFGVVTAYVTGPEAARYHFTSALPVQVLKGLAPVLMPYVARAQGEQDRSGMDGVAPRAVALPPPADTPAAEANPQVRPKSTRMITINRMRPRPPLG
jgi:membrane peptidoglycan carboxypeptidase